MSDQLSLTEDLQLSLLEDDDGGEASSPPSAVTPPSSQLGPDDPWPDDFY